MIKCHFAELLGRKKIKILGLSKELDIHRSSLDLLYHETATRVDLNLVNKLCNYFKCEVGELFEYIEDT